jgi:hypothetical protein
MLEDATGYHQHLQEFYDCYLGMYPKKELEKASKRVSGDPGRDMDEFALKFLGHGMICGASKKLKTDLTI